jgi:crotonobetainyl-CoA:carnitine CoA-transferase CaiB-like acyl-CoA transferase
VQANVEGPLSGVRVVEIAVMVAAPSATAMMAALGADVIKVEPPTGDPWRGAWAPAMFEHDNRGKRSVALDLTTAEAREVMERLLAEADVFVTNVRPGGLARIGLDPESVRARHPTLVYAVATGYGHTGPGADKAGYDIGAYWARSGFAATVVGDGVEPPIPRPGMGDHVTALALLSAVNAALFQRTRTGDGSLVSTSLMRAGTFVVSSDLSVHLAGQDHLPGRRRLIGNPLLGCYRAADSRWFFLLGLQHERHWPKLCAAIGRLDLADDPRFATTAEVMRRQPEVLEVLDTAFAEHTLDEWAEIFAAHDVWWDPVQNLAEVVADPLIDAVGTITTDVDGNRVVAPPFDIGGWEAPLGRVPELGEHTELVLLEMGYDWDAIIALKEAGALP